MKKPIKKTIIIYTAVIGLLVFLYLMGLLKPIETVALKVLNPITSRLYRVSTDIRKTYSDRTTKHGLQIEIDELHDQINSLLEEKAELENIKEENKVLRDNLRFLSKKEYNYSLANILSRDSAIDKNGRTESVIIDQGTKDGLAVGLAVVNGKGILVGKISEVKDAIARVNLTNNENCKIAATALNDDRTSGITEGELGLTIKMSFIPQDREININDIIVTSGLEPMIPRGLIIGRVIEVDKENNELWQEAIIEPIIDPDELIIVTVLNPLAVE